MNNIEKLEYIKSYYLINNEYLRSILGFSNSYIYQITIGKRSLSEEAIKIIESFFDISFNEDFVLKGNDVITSIIDLRKKAGFSIREMAKELEVPFSTIGNIENRRYNLSFKIAEKYINYFKITLKEFMFDSM